MTSRSSSEQVDDVSRLLPSLARLVARGAAVTEQHIELLAVASDIDMYPELATTCIRLSGLLGKARDESMRDVVEEALLLRGLPDDVVRSALNVVAPMESDDATALGDEHALAENTSVRPNAYPEGVRNQEDQAVSSSSGQPSGTELVVHSDGSGTHMTLAEAVYAAPPGATIRLGPGTHTVPEDFMIVKPLTLVGSGMDSTEVFGAEGLAVLHFLLDPDSVGASYDKPTHFALRDLSVRYAGSENTARAVIVGAGGILFERCRFTSAAHPFGAGLHLGLEDWGPCTGLVRACVAEKNAHGIWSCGTAHVTLENNIVQDNSVTGISYGQCSGGVARGNICVRNGSHGIVLSGTADPLLENNTCDQNGNSGIALMEQAKAVLIGNTCTASRQGSGIASEGDAGFTARRNRCSGCAQQGILVTSVGEVELEQNVCSENGQAGIVIGAGAAQCRGNRCTENDMGIAVAATSQPHLVDNQVEDNRFSGIVFSGQSGGSARACVSIGNGRHGLMVLDHAAPTLEDNRLERNGRSGLVYENEGGGVARNNICRNNQEGGITVAPTAHPNLSGNQDDGASGNPAPHSDVKASGDSPPGSVLVVAADGSGTHRTLSSALTAAQPGAVISIMPGVYRIAGGLELEKPVTLIGTGDAERVLIAEEGSCVLLAKATEKTHIENITIHWDGHPDSSMVGGIVITGGEVSVRNCVVDGQVREHPASPEYEDEAVDWSQRGAGILMRQSARVKVEKCTIRGSTTGIWVSDDAVVMLDENIVETAVTAIRCDADSTGEVTRNVCKNSQVGVYCTGKSTVTMRENRCSSNVDGIACGGSSTPTVSENTCEGNEKAGIVFFSQASGAIQSNRCGSNGYHGIYVGDVVNASVSFNMCTGNRQYGIWVGGRAGGNLTGNTCSTNAVGIRIDRTATASLDANKCEGNVKKDIEDQRQGRSLFRRG